MCLLAPNLNSSNKDIKTRNAITYFDKINKVVVIFAVKGTSDSIAALCCPDWYTTFLGANEFVVCCVEILSLFALQYHFLRRRPDSNNKQFEQLLFINCWEQRSASH